MDKFQKRHLEHIKHSCLQTIKRHKLIAEDDKVLIGLSGGKDSLVLTEVLAHIRRYAGFNYSLTACHIKVKDVPYEINRAYLEDFCGELQVPFLYIETSYENTESDKSPCYFCSWTRRKKFFELSQSDGYNRLATGHHMDDAIETHFMNMIYHGRSSSLPQKLTMFDGRMDIIRPFLEIDEASLAEYAAIRQFPKLKTVCPFDRESKRSATREIIEQICADFPQARINLFNAQRNSVTDYLPS